VQGAGKPVQGSCGAVGCCRAATAGLRRRGVGEWLPDNGVAYGLKGLAQKEARGSRVLTEGLRWTDCGAGEPTSLTGGESRAAFGEVAAEGRSGLLGSTDRRAVKLRRSCRVQGGRSTNGVE